MEIDKLKPIVYNCIDNVLSKMFDADSIYYMLSKINLDDGKIPILIYTIYEVIRSEINDEECYSDIKKICVDYLYEH